MKDTLNIGVGGEYAVRLPIENFALGAVPLTRVRVVAEDGDNFLCEIDSYQSTNVYEFQQDNLARAIADGAIRYMPIKRLVVLSAADFVKPWTNAEPYVWAVGPPRAQPARKRRRQAPVAVQASS